MAVSFIMIIALTLLVMETVVGLVANGFILLMNYIDWCKSRKLSPADLILTCLAVSRLMWQTVVILEEIMIFFSLGTYNGIYLSLSIFIMWVFTKTVNVWFATWLSVFYFAKIATFSHPIFLQAKQRISGLVPWLLLGSAVLSAIVCIVVFGYMSNDLSTCDLYSSHSRIDDSKTKKFDSCRYFDIVAIAPDSVPFLIFLSSSFLLITSLWKHTRRLQQNRDGIQDLNTQAHLTAIKALASFTLLYLSSSLALISQAILVWGDMDRIWPYTLVDIVLAAYPSGHALILILINPRLKQTWVRMLHRLQRCLSEMSS